MLVYVSAEEIVQVTRCQLVEKLEAKNLKETMLNSNVWTFNGMSDLSDNILFKNLR